MFVDMMYKYNSKAQNLLSFPLMYLFLLISSTLPNKITRKERMAKKCFSLLCHIIADVFIDRHKSRDGVFFGKELIATTFHTSVLYYVLLFFCLSIMLRQFTLMCRQQIRTHVFQNAEFEVTLPMLHKIVRKDKNLSTNIKTKQKKNEHEPCNSDNTPYSVQLCSNGVGCMDECFHYPKDCIIGKCFGSNESLIADLVRMDVNEST